MILLDKPYDALHISLTELRIGECYFLRRYGRTCEDILEHPRMS